MDDPSAKGGKAIKLLNTHYECCVLYSMDKVVFAPGVKYRVRAHVRVEPKAGKTGEAFWAGVHNGERNKWKGSCRPKVTAAKDVRWSCERAKAWGDARSWYCGVNYIPANAINYTAMWDKTSFSPEVIRKELRLATEIGMNCVRVVIQYKVFEDDPAYLLKVFDIARAKSNS